VLEAAFILLEFPSPSRRIFIGSHSLPPLWFAVSVHDKQPSKPKHNNTHSGNLHGLLPMLHRSDRWPTSVTPVTALDRWTEPVRPVAAAAAQQLFQRASVTYLGPGTRTPSKTQPAPRTDQQHNDPKTHESSSSPEANPTSGIHRLDWSHTPVRPVKPGQLRMNSTRGSIPPNLTPDLPNRSTDLHNTLGIVGTPHEESIAKFMPIKSCQIKRNRGNPAKNSSNPRTPKTPKLSLLTHGFGRGIKGKRTTKGSHRFPPSNPQEQGPKNTLRKPARESSENHYQEQPGTTQQSH
jgi:hypothetical protein